MEWLGGALLGVVVGGIILRERYMRSMRVVLLVTAFSAAASAIFEVVPRWNPGDAREFAITGLVAMVGVGVALLPYVVAHRLEGAFSALPPADYAEHDRIRSIRASMFARPAEKDEVEFVRLLEGTELAAEDWKPAREALIAQIEMTSRDRTGEQPITASEAMAARHRTVAAWRSAIQHRSRFFR